MIKKGLVLNMQPLATRQGSLPPLAKSRHLQYSGQVSVSICIWSICTIGSNYTDVWGVNLVWCSQLWLNVNYKQTVMSTNCKQTIMIAMQYLVSMGCILAEIGQWLALYRGQHWMYVATTMYAVLAITVYTYTFHWVYTKYIRHSHIINHKVQCMNIYRNFFFMSFVPTSPIIFSAGIADINKSFKDATR